ncbi:MAG: B12-binding domain-containing radical SAM protein [Candidatus Riflebacteria bacterium]|nr:B12-binding domain-containing radical SAM protein [Candidatus Riflebacteria bacterium]
MAQVVLVALNTRHTHSSLSLACLQSYWNRLPKRPPIECMDFDMNKGTDALIQELILRRPRLIGFSVYIWSLVSALTVSGAVKAALPDTRIVFGGPEVSFEAEALMTTYPWIDAVVRGEGEETFDELLQKFFDETPWAGTSGLTHRTGKSIITEPERPFIRDLDILPSPFLAGCYGNGKGFTYYEASRGCPYRCTYCLSSVLGPVRQLSLERVFRELDWFMQSDFTQVRFADRTFNQDSRRAMAIVQHILNNNSRGTAFHFELKADLLTDELIALLGKAPPGLFHLEIGVQSTHSPSLEAVARHCDISRLADRIRAIRENSACHIHLDLLAGLPGEDFSCFKKTLNDAHAWKPTSIQVGLVKILKGTALRKHLENGEMSCAPFPPYAIQRSAWLSAEDIVRCQDMARLVEGIGNSGRFSGSLEFLSRKVFHEDWAEMYLAFALFWRKFGKPFYGFGPEIVRDGLQGFLTTLACDEFINARCASIILHEYRLNQKVPSGKTGPHPELPSLGDKPLDRRASGLKPFWYSTDPLEPVTTQTATEDGHNIHLPTPVIYSYQTDLSQSPETRIVNLPILERFVMALVDQVSNFKMLHQAWIKTGRSELPEAAFQDALDKLRGLGLLYKPRTGLSHSHD